MKDISYLDMLKKAFFVTWENKFLWVFGFVVFLGSFFSNINMNKSELFNQMNNSQQLSDWIQKYSVAIASLGVLFVLVVVSLFFLRILANIGIIMAVNDINLYKQLPLLAIFSQARKHLKRALFLEIIMVISLALLISVLLIPVAYLFALGAKLSAILAAMFACVIIFPLLVLTYYLRKFGYLYVVLGEATTRQAIESAYSLFERNIKESLLLGLVNIGLNVGVLFVVLTAMLVLIIILLPVAFFANWFFAKIGVMSVLIVGSLFGIGTTVTIVSWFEAFLQTVWVYFFQQIAFIKNDKRIVMEEKTAEGEIPSPEAV